MRATGRKNNHATLSTRWPMHLGDLLGSSDSNALRKCSLPLTHDEIRSAWPILYIRTGTRSELEIFFLIGWTRPIEPWKTLKFKWSISDEHIEVHNLNLFKGGRFNTTNLLDISTRFKKKKTPSNICIFLHLTTGVSSNNWWKERQPGSCVPIPTHTHYSTLHKFREHLLLINYLIDFIDRILNVQLPCKYVGKCTSVNPRDSAYK